MGSKSTETVQKQSFPKISQPLFRELTDGGIAGFNNAQDVIDSRGGQLFARRTPTQNLGDQLGLETAASGVNLGAGVSTVADNLAGRLQNNQLFDPNLTGQGSTDAAIEAAINPIQRRFEEDILPGFLSQASIAGAGNNSRLGIETAKLTDRAFTQPALDATAQLSFQDLLSRRNLDVAQTQTELQASQLLPQLFAQGFDLNLAPTNVLEQIGLRQQGEIQQILDEQIQAPFVGANEAAALLTGINPLSATTTAGTSGGKVGGAIQGGVGGAASGFAVGGPIGAGIGGGLGILGGLF